VAPVRRPHDGLAKLAALALLLAVAFVTVRFTSVGAVLTREGVAELIAALRGSSWAPVAFVGTYAVATALALPGTILTLTGGAVFGFTAGTVLNWLGANIGATLAFLLARSMGREGLRTLLGKRVDALDEATDRYGFRSLLTLRLIPVVPFNALNFGGGLTSMSWKSYALGTAIGVIPGTAVYTYFADALLQGSQESSREAWIRVVVAGLLLALLALLPTMYRRIVERSGAKEKDPCA
jgi:uncharacterized membrane protein YdjX (TVP38/TMEM64 family)